MIKPWMEHVVVFIAKNVFHHGFKDPDCHILASELVTTSYELASTEGNG